MKLKFFAIILALSVNTFSQSEAPVVMTSAQYETENLGEFANKTSSNAAAVIIQDSLVFKSLNFLSIDDFLDPQLASSVKYFKGSAESSDSMAIIENYCGKFLYVKKNSEWRIDKFKMEKPNISLRQIRAGSSSKEVYERLKLKQGKKIGNGQMWIMSTDGKKHIELTFVNDKVVLMELI
jgi:hypothetical protein